MKFTVKNEFKAKAQTCEVGNTHDSEKREDISTDDIMRWYRAGWVEVEGEAPAPDLNPQRSELVVQNTSHNHKAETVK